MPCRPSTRTDTVGEFIHIIHCPSLANAEMRVVAGSSPAQKSLNRCRLIAHATATLCKCVLDNPRYRERRIPTERTPCEIVDSMPDQLFCYMTASTQVCAVQSCLLRAIHALHEEAVQAC